MLGVLFQLKKIEFLVIVTYLYFIICKKLNNKQQYIFSSIFFFFFQVGIPACCFQVEFKYRI